MSEELILSYERGMRFLKSRRDELSDRRTHEATWWNLAKLGRDAAALRLRDQLAKQFGVDKREFLRDVQFAAAVETIVGNCGHYARKLLFNTERPQRREAIVELSRTSDTRQRYRVEGVRAGRFRSVARQNSDPVYDTVSFSEVPSRLRRGRGNFRLLPEHLSNGVTEAVRSESRRLAELCRQSAVTLRGFVGTGQSDAPAIPVNLQKEIVLPAIKNEVSGKVVGMGRQMLRMTIKSVWDYPEMQRRGIFPTESEQQQTIQDSHEIIAIAEDILRH